MVGSIHLTMKRINFGAGQCRLEGWQNTDFTPDYQGEDRIDMTKPLPFADGSVDVCFSEMALEHITHQQGWSFLCECYRILKPAGLIRVVVPDFSLTWRLKDKDWLRVNQGVTQNDGTLREQMKSILFCHGHQSLWNAELLRDVMEAIGFTGTAIHLAGQSNRPALVGLEQHWRSVGIRVAAAESGCVEGMK